MENTSTSEENEATIDSLSEETITQIKTDNGYGDWTNEEFRKYWKSKLK